MALRLLYVSAIANAVSPPPAAAGASSPHVAGAVSGLGAGEARRRALSVLEVDHIIQAEISERLRVARDYEPVGRIRPAPVKLRTLSRSKIGSAW
jgi:hypothetical protein